MIEHLIRAGLDVARLNFSHSTHAEHAGSISILRETANRLHKPIAILSDLQGPKIRTGPLAGGMPVTLRAGQRFVITTARVLGDSTRVSTTFTPLPREVHKGDRILLADGLIELRVEGVRGGEVVCEVMNGGELGEHKGINLPGVRLRVSAITPKDRADLAFALAHGANYVAVSFVRRAEDVLQAKAAIRRAGKDTPVIAKLEKPEAIENLDAILRVADGVMVARGDLGVEMNLERVPVVQKEIIARAREFRRPVITATQMLESMTQNPRPTRAEASDVANAIFDGTDAVMLSAETAAGRYPVESVAMMARIIEEAEASIRDFPRTMPQEQLKVAETVAELVCHASRELQMKLIAVLPPAGAHHRVFSGGGNSEAAGIDLGRRAEKYPRRAQDRRARGDRGGAPARGAPGAKRRRHRYRGGNSHGRARHDEFHEIPYHRWRRLTGAVEEAPKPSATPSSLLLPASSFF